MDSIYNEFGEMDVSAEQEASRSLFRYHDIVKDDMVNGAGLRVVLFLAGCTHRCPGCQNPETWCKDSGVPFTLWDKAELFSALEKPYVKGLTISGGDPLFPGNREGVWELLDEVKSLFPKKDIWVYTGYTLRKDPDNTFRFYEDCPWKKEQEGPFELPWLSMIDVLVDGPYLQETRKADLANGHDPKWCGSSNQRVIDVKSSLATGAITLLN